MTIHLDHHGIGDPGQFDYLPTKMSYIGSHLDGRVATFAAGDRRIDIKPDIQVRSERMMVDWVGDCDQGDGIENGLADLAVDCVSCCENRRTPCG